MEIIFDFYCFTYISVCLYLSVQAGDYTQPTYRSPESNGKLILGCSLHVIGQPTIPHSRHLYLYE